MRAGRSHHLCPTARGPTLLRGRTQPCALSSLSILSLAREAEGERNSRSPQIERLSLKGQRNYSRLSFCFFSDASLPWCSPYLFLYFFPPLCPLCWRAVGSALSTSPHLHVSLGDLIWSQAFKKQALSIMIKVLPMKGHILRPLSTSTEHFCTQGTYLSHVEPAVAIGFQIPTKTTETALCNHDASVTVNDLK